jgi:molybdopterin-guanine dinucleotide biosynthesis protein A
MDRSLVSAAILAGGRARRFGGRDKSRLLVQGRPIIIRQVEVLQRVAADLFVVAPDPERFADLGLAVHPDRVAGAGAVGGIYTALESAAADRVIVVACDLPFLDAGVLARLVELAGGGDGAWIRTPRGVEPLLACYRRGARGAIRAAIDAGRLKAGGLDAVIRMVELPARELERLGATDRLLTNVNSLDDLTRVQ